MNFPSPVREGVWGSAGGGLGGGGENRPFLICNLRTRLCTHQRALALDLKLSALMSANDPEQTFVTLDACR